MKVKETSRKVIKFDCELDIPEDVLNSNDVYDFTHENLSDVQ